VDRDVGHLVPGVDLDADDVWMFAEARFDAGGAALAGDGPGWDYESG
jgi:hypothetical protein